MEAELLLYSWQVVDDSVSEVGQVLSPPQGPGPPLGVLPLRAGSGEWCPASLRSQTKAVPASRNAAGPGPSGALVPVS